jgi:hypothetical protein
MCASTKRVFITAARYDGNLGGLAGADAKCATAAAAVNLGGTWKAWLSDANTNAIDRIADVGPWYFVGLPIKVFNNKANLATLPLRPVAVTERGEVLSSSQAVWSATDVGGKRVSSTAAYSCQNWTDDGFTSSSQKAPTGDASRADNGWTYSSSEYCYQSLRLYCLQQ